MRLVTVIIVVVALVISGVTAFLILRFLQSQSTQPVVEHELVPAERVLVAKVDLGSRAVLKEDEHFAWQAWPRDGVAPDYVTETSGKSSEFAGAAVKYRIAAGEPITATKVIRPGEQSFMSAILTPGMRAVTARVNVETGVAGFISPGDRVDLLVVTGLNVLVPFATPDGRTVVRDATRQFSELILSDLRVLAINQVTGQLGEKAFVGSNITFEVTQKQAEIIAVARNMGELYLTLRSHISPEVKAPAREYPFTSELELMMSAHDAVSQRYVAKVTEELNARFGIEEEKEEPPAAKPAPVAKVQQLPRESAPPAPTRPRQRPQEEAPPAPGASSREETKAAPEAEPDTVIKAVSQPQSEDLAVREPEPEPVVEPEPVIEEVRIDRGGQVQTLRFEDGELAGTRGQNVARPIAPTPTPQLPATEGAPANPPQGTAQ